MADIFSGMSAAKPMEICQRLGRCDGSSDDLTGALMTLCRTVAALELRIARLEEEIAETNQRINQHPNA